MLSYSAHQSMITLNNKGVKHCMHNKLNNFYYNNFNQESRSKAMVIKVEYCDFLFKTSNNGPYFKYVAFKTRI